MTEAFALTSAHAGWEELIRFAFESAWRAGPFLAEKMRADDFLPWERVFAACVDGAPAGYCTLTAQDELPPETGFTPFIGFVYVDPAFRGHRLSEILVNAASAYARSVGFDRVYLMSGEKGLYEKYGFRFLGMYPTVFGSEDQLFVKSTKPE